MRARKLLVLLAASSLGVVGCADRSAAQPEPTAPTPQVVSVGVAPPVPATGSSRVLAGDDSEPDSSAWRPGDPAPPLWLRPDLATAQAPDRFVVVMDTTKGEVVVHVERAWAPRGVDRFYNLVRMGFYTDIMDVVDSLYTGYGEGPPYGKGPSQAEMQTRGNEYARAGFPRLDYLRSIRITY